MRIAGVYYDGRQAKAHPVTLCVEDDKLVLQGKEVVRREVLQSLTIPPPLGKTPRLVLFTDGGRCEVADRQGFAALLPDAANHAISGVESSWFYALAALALTLVLIAGAYFFGLPYLAREVADRIPASLATQMDTRIFDSFDQRLFKPSSLPTARQQSLSDRFEELRLPETSAQAAHLAFRGAPGVGANALTLPGGTIVVFDELVKLAENDEEIMAVLAHELGHVAEKHALRQMLQASVVGLAMAWYVGDVGSLVAAAPTVLLESRYSRDFERRADSFAAELLRAKGLSVERLAAILSKLEAAHQSVTGQTSVESAGPFDYLSSHPNTQERILRLRQIQ